MFILPCQAVFALIIPLSLTKYSIIWNISNVVLPSQALVHCSSSSSSSLLCSALAAASICKVKYHAEVGFPRWSKWPVIRWSYGPLLSVRCDCGDAYGPSLYIVQTLSRVTEGSSHRMLLGNECDWSTAIAFPLWTLQPHSSLKWDVCSLCGNTARRRDLLYVTSVNPETSDAHAWPKHHENSCRRWLTYIKMSMCSIILYSIRLTLLGNTLIGFLLIRRSTLDHVFMVIMKPGLAAR